VPRELTASDAVDAVWGGRVLACGGGGWVWHGELMGDLATRVGRPILASVEEVPDEALVATVTAIGAPAAQGWEIRPVDYVRALQRLMELAPAPIVAVLTAQNGASTTLNGWIQSAVLGVRVLDAAGDVRAHPTGKLGSMGLTEREGFETTQVVYGGNRERHGTLEVVARGTVYTTDDVLRDVSVRSGGFIAAARHPVEAAWVKRHGALGAISYALELGAAMRAAAERGGDAVLQAASEVTGGSVLASGTVETVEPLRTSGGFDHGAFRVGDVVLRYLNEYMVADGDDQRLATYPDVLATLSPSDGRTVTIGDVREGMELAVFHVSRDRLPLSSSNRDRTALEEVERIMGVDLTSHVLDPAEAP
jgi:DUF917 family protein